MKTVLITGATSGIGLACARKFAENGDRLILTGRNEHLLSDIRKELAEKGTEVMTLAFDIRDREKAKKYINGLSEAWQDIDVLVNNAGLALGLEPEYEGDLDDWETMIDTNIKGLLTMTRLIVPGMVKRNSGHIINIGSVAGDAAYAGGNVYCATKAAVKALTDGLRIDVADTAIRVTNLKPGLVETNFSNVRFKAVPRSYIQASSLLSAMILLTWLSMLPTLPPMSRLPRCSSSLLIRPVVVSLFANKCFI